MRVYGNHLLRWYGDVLRLGRGRKLAEIVQDAKYPMMWRVRKRDGSLSDMLNRTRAKDAAQAMALSILNSEETGGEHGSIRQNHPPLVG